MDLSPAGGIADLPALRSATESPSAPPEGGPVTLFNYIGGAFLPAADGRTLEDVDPSTGRVAATLPRSSGVDVDAAVAAARGAGDGWRRTSVTHRAALLDAIADALEAWGPELAAMESADSGKTIRMASNVDIPRSVANFRFFAGQIRHDETGCYAMHDAINYATREPLGVAGLISPWNLPLYLLSWKVAPALACGNTVVAKPSEITPRTATALAAIMHAVGVPPGVFNLIHGLGGEAGARLVAHPDVPLISFTGGTATGKLVGAAAAPLFKKVSLELGGKNATVIFDSATLDTVVAGAARSAFTNNGQVCLAGSRIFVQRGIAPAFLPAFIAAVKRMRCGPPAAADSDVGPVSSAPHLDKVKSYVDLAVAEGGVIACGGSAPASLAGTPYAGGYYLEPTVITGLPHTSRVATEEIFGPVCTVHTFDTEDDVVAGVNASRYGLAGSLWTNDLTQAHRVARRIESGILWVNCWLHRYVCRVGLWLMVI